MTISSQCRAKSALTSREPRRATLVGVQPADQAVGEREHLRIGGRRDRRCRTSPPPCPSTATASPSPPRSPGGAPPPADPRELWVRSAGAAATAANASFPTSVLARAVPRHDAAARHQQHLRQATVAEAVGLPLAPPSVASRLAPPMASTLGGAEDSSHSSVNSEPVAISDDDRARLAGASNSRARPSITRDEPFGSTLVDPDGRTCSRIATESRTAIATHHPEFAIARWAATTSPPTDAPWRHRLHLR